MNKMPQAHLLAGILSLLAGAILGLGGTNWIELRFGLFPDGGDGLLEFSFVAIAFVIGASLLIPALKRHTFVQGPHPSGTVPVRMNPAK